MSKIIIASGPVIVKDRKALLDISSGDDFWKFCGGKINENETLIEAATRRTKEELGIDIKVIDDRPYIMHTKKSTADGEVDIILVHWLSEYNGEIKPGQDVEAWDWVEIDNLPKNIGPNIKPALRHFLFLK